MGKRTPGPLGRQQARALNAADARTILRAELPLVLKHMSEKQLDQMQRVLDAAVVNPAVEKEANDIYRRSARAQSGSLILRDEKMVRRADRVMERFIHITEADKRIPLDFEALLADDALQQRTDNPDEADYLDMVWQTLADRGVWLRIGPKLVRDPQASRHIVSQRSFEVWLSLGPDGDAIPTDTGRLTREALLGTTVLGAGYYTKVNRGRIQSAFDQQIRRLQIEIEAGIEQHNVLAKIRREAAPGVVPVADLLGGADFPDRSIWDSPHQLVVRALRENVAGNTGKSPRYLLAAAELTRNAARRLAQYIDDTSAGAERAVAVLKIVKTVAEVVETVLSVVTVGAGVVRVARGAASAARARWVIKNRSPAAFAPTNKVAPKALAKTKDAVGATGGTTGGGVATMGPREIARQERITGWVRDFNKELAVASNARGGRSVQVDVVEEIATLCDRKWGKVWEELR